MAHEAFHYPIQVENENETGQQLLEIQLNETESERGNDGQDERNDLGRRRNVYPGELGSSLLATVPSGKTFTGKGRDLNDHHLRFDRYERSSALSDVSAYFKRESSSRDKALCVGFSSSTTTGSYRCGTKIVGTRYGVCFQETHKPKSIDDKKTAVVYEPVQQNYSPLQPAVLRFTTDNEN